MAALQRRVAELETEAEVSGGWPVIVMAAPTATTFYRFIESETGSFSVAALCRATRAARSSYYEWRKRSEGPSAALVDEAYMANRVYDVWKRSRGRYGSPRVTAALAKAGVEVNEKRVARLMAELGITGRCGRRKIRTTWRDKRQQGAIDLVLRHFTAAAPDEIWVGDITLYPDWAGVAVCGFGARCSLEIVSGLVDRRSSTH